MLLPDKSLTLLVLLSMLILLGGLTDEHTRSGTFGATRPTDCFSRRNEGVGNAGVLAQHGEVAEHVDG